MTDTPSQTQTSTFAAANETVREVARDVRQGLGDVWTTHDLRGFALMSGMALQGGA